jgi:serine/threonine protein kinase
MDCPSCQTTNLETAYHCQRCGALLPVLEHLPNGSKLGTITLERVLGRGGFGITYLGRLEDGRQAAIKEFFPEGAVQRLRGGMVLALPDQKLEFERLLVRAQFEAETLQLLQHESATAFYGTWQQNGTMYMAMEFIAGHSLESRIQSGVKLREIEARAVLMACLGVLQELHGLGLLHRDIKPANIMLGAFRVELIDYGSAVKFKIGERIKRERLLTPMYAPLEQFGKEVQLTPATDFYALAATIYHALTQVAPPNALERARGAVLKPIRELEPHINPTFAKVIDDSLALKLELRPQSAIQMMNVLRHGQSLNLATKDPPLPTFLESLCYEARDFWDSVKKVANRR